VAENSLGLRVAGSVKYTGVARGCAVEKQQDACVTYSGQDVFGYKNVIGQICHCNGDLCNSAPQLSAGRLTVSFTVASLLALAAARVLAG